MKRLRLSLLVFLILLGSISALLQGAPSDLVYVVNVDGEIDPGLARVIQKNIAKAEQDGATAIIFQISTFGGLVASATEIRDMILDTPVQTVAFVKDRAWSAGALITLACDQIYMTPESSMGAAETRPKDEKIISAFRKEFKATAERQGRNPDLAAAMVDADIAIEGIVEEGKILTLTAAEAVEYGMADKSVYNLYEILPLIGAEGGRVQVLEQSITDRLARWITNPYIATLLITIGFIGLILEALTMGWGVGGTIGILALTLFFSGNLLVGNTSWGLILLFIAGIILLGLEILVVPGFGVTGVTGLILVVSSLYLTFEDPVVGLYGISFALVLGLASLIVFFRFIGYSKAWSKIALNTVESKESGYLAPVIRNDLLGLEGETLSTLRPTGIALIGEEGVDVVSEGGYIVPGCKIKVIKVEGTKIIVREI